jgi:signal transduction histidine kinase
VGASTGFREGAGEILRQASVALGGRTVTLYEVSSEPALVPQVSSDPNPGHHDTKVDLDTTLRRWGVPIREGSLWLGCRLDDHGPWVIAPVRAHPAAPPPGGRERRSAERLTLELAGLCLGLVDRRDRSVASVGDALQPVGPLHELLNLPAVIAHEAQNPLTAARAGLQLIVESVGRMADLGADRRLELLAELGDVGEAIDRAVDYLRAVADRARGRVSGPVRFDAVRIVRSCVALEGRLLRQRGAVVELETDLEGLFLLGDPNLLYEMVLALIRHAAEAAATGPAGGRATPVRVHVDRADDGLVLTVRDEGPGIPVHLLSRVFEPGFTLRGFAEGTTPGPSLATVRTIAQNSYGGTVSVRSQPGAGTTFTVTLPMPPQRGVRTPEADAAAR